VYPTTQQNERGAFRKQIDPSRGLGIPRSSAGHIPRLLGRGINPLTKNLLVQKESTQPFAEALSIVIACFAAMSNFNRGIFSRSWPVTRTKRAPSG
jgi:hypothetical protein